MAILLFAIIPVSCGSDDDSNSECDDVFCTLEFITIVVTIIDQNQDPFALDSFQVVNLENGEDITIPLTPSELTEAQERGIYPLVSDGVFGLNQEKQIQFKGFLNNQEVISSDYVVETDCCHLSSVSGDLELTIQ